MNKNDLDLLERFFDISLPDEYRSTMVNYPFEEDIGTINWSLWDDIDPLIKWNQEYRVGYGACPKWPKNYFLLGSDHDACPYALDLDTGVVIKTNHGRLADEPLEEYNSFSEFLNVLKKEYEE